MQLYDIVRQLEIEFPGRHFTLDGHLVGSIGEVLGAHYYRLELLPATEEGHDATTRDGRRVQIKASQRDSVGLRSEPQSLLVLKLNIDGTFEEIYNGSGAKPWENSGPMQRNGQRSITFFRLRQLMKDVRVEERLPRVVAESI
jgi:hypothetical protein